MNIFVRNYRKCGFKTELVLPIKRYSTAHICTNMLVRHRQDNYVPRSYFGKRFLSTNKTTEIASVLSNKNLNRMGFPSKPYVYNISRNFYRSHQLLDQPSSKVEVTVQTMKNKQKEKVEEIMKEACTTTPDVINVSHKEDNVSDAAAATKKLNEPTSKPMVVKKPLKDRIWEELVHYYHGFRLLVIDINICRKLLWRILNGKTLNRRENRLLLRTTSDLFRLIPFSVFIVVPFLELLLPLFIKFFPGMLPSTFQTAKEREDRLKQSVQVRIEMVKFLQKTLDEMAVQHKEHKSEEAKQFDMFFQKIKNPNEYVSNEEINKYAKRFEDEITLDSLSREQLIALCRVLELNTVGTTNFLRFQLRMKLRSLATDDRAIAREGVNSLDLWELQQACKSRGMRAYGLTEERMRTQLQEWIDLSLNEKVPPTLLLLSRTMLLSDDSITTDKLKETLRKLPDSLATQTKAAIGEREGKIDNKTQIEIIKEEERKIKEEREEEREEERAKAKIKARTEPEIGEMMEVMKESDPICSERNMIIEAAKIEKRIEEEKSISSKDVALLNEALKTLSTDKKMLVEKEAIKEIKEELEEYKEDVKELKEVGRAVQEPVAESRAAKLLFKKVNRMIGQLDKVLDDLESKHKQQLQEEYKAEVATKQEIQSKRKEEFLHIDELVQTIKKLKQTSDESKLTQIVNVLSKLDSDKDGVITVDEVLKVVEAIGRENVKLNEKQLEELIALLDKEQLLEAEDKIEKALAKSQKDAEEAKKTNQAFNEYREKSVNTVKYTKPNCKTPTQPCEDLLDPAKLVKDTCKDLNITDQKNNLKTDKIDVCKNAAILEAAEKQREKILPKNDKHSPMPSSSTIAAPPPPSKATQINSKDKMI
uniref:Mitochondrial proton/calcium exchanger protein n=1 Tax=Glossina brevipalpis TaxID=37001 RepID=A0A1A9WBX2_9MUSC